MGHRKFQFRPVIKASPDVRPTLSTSKATWEQRKAIAQTQGVNFYMIFAWQYPFPKKFVASQIGRFVTNAQRQGASTFRAVDSATIHSRRPSYSAYNGPSSSEDNRIGSDVTGRSDRLMSRSIWACTCTYCTCQLVNAYMMCLCKQYTTICTCHGSWTRGDDDEEFNVSRITAVYIYNVRMPWH
jgi:hypothetical protein